MTTTFSYRDLWIAGESYAGVYIPTLSENILSNSSSSLFQQFRGIMAGNPVFNCPTLLEPDYSIEFNLLYFHGLISFEHFSNWTSLGCNTKKESAECFTIYEAAVAQIGIIYQELVVGPIIPKPSLDPDDLYQDFCTGNGTLEFTKNDPKDCQGLNSGPLLTNYLNRKDVQQAIGARSTRWSVCSDKESLLYGRSGANMNDYYNKFFDQKPSLSILIYSGDVDIKTVPFGITQPCLAQLNRSMTSNWQPWYVNGWTAGYVQTFDTYTYVTIKGSGHEAPQYQPLSALNMFRRFLTTQSLKPSPEELELTYNDRKRIWSQIMKNKPLSQSDMLRRFNIRV